ncbi:MAG: outer membrane protein transport protein [Gammaproteobacteria bacterium]|nr:outer membrane protein transport protein [Gammaproteobacteria bacterium]MBU2478912.1 outer membrane protein transport protein [Gammaproteobacteria bacterium]
MKGNITRSLVAVAVASAIAAPAAYATNGYFKIGYGTKNRGMAGAGIAYSQDSIAPATNPSGIAFTGNRVDFGMELFNPRRDASLDATGMFGANTGKVDSGATLFAIPHAGFAFGMGDMTVGMSISANGGMNTRYNSNLYANAFGPAVGAFAGVIGGMAPAVAAGLASDPDVSSTLGVNLSQVIIAPTVAYQLNQDHSVGASALIGYQRFRSYGLGLFKGLSSSGAHVTNKGDDDAWGAGVRLGYTGNLTSNITVGAQYSSKIYMQEFDRYKGLFAEQGDFDIPSNFGVGIAVKVTPATTVAFDVQRILYGDVAAIANKGPTADQYFTALSSVLGSGMPYSGAGSLGTDDGWGFGWEDTTVYKLGINHELNSQWTIRGGLNYGSETIEPDQNLFNILAPGIVQRHVTLGFTYMPTQYNEISMTFMHALREEQSETFTATPALGPFAGANYAAEIGMDQNAIEISYGMKF